MVTPDRIVLSDVATAVVAPGVMGSFGILTNHAPFLSELATGELRYRRDNAEEIRLAVSGGFLQVYHNQVTVLADSAEKAGEIDVDRARRARDQARGQLSMETGLTGVEREQAQAALDRANNRISVAGA